MATETTKSVVNGRLTDLPPNATDADLRRLGGIAPGRIVMRRTREGNYVVPRGSVLPPGGGFYVDAPPRKKG